MILVVQNKALYVWPPMSVHAYYGVCVTRNLCTNKQQVLPSLYEVQTKYIQNESVYGQYERIITTYITKIVLNSF